MDNFEKRMYLEYLNKSFNIISFDHSKILEDIESYLKIDIKKISKFNEKYECWSVYTQKLKLILKNKLSKCRTAPTTLENKFDLVAKIYDLNELEKQLFIFYMLKEINPIFCKLDSHNYRYQQYFRRLVFKINNEYWSC